MRHVQLEPVWGGSSDTAAELRAICAMGLANTSRDGAVRQAAILALGASRRADAIERMKQRFQETADVETRKCILLSLATSRTDPAIEFVLGLIREGSAHISEFAVSAMEINRGDVGIHEQVERAIRGRNSSAPPSRSS